MITSRWSSGEEPNPKAVYQIQSLQLVTGQQQAGLKHRPALYFIVV
jgi:hypothetical protein